jgi:hypothetical protein
VVGRPLGALVVVVEASSSAVENDIRNGRHCFVSGARWSLAEYLIGLVAETDVLVEEAKDALDLRSMVEGL